MPIDNIIHHFNNISDSRKDNKQHKLIDVIFITICAVLCMVEKWEDIELFGLSKEAWLKKYIELPHGIPSYDTIARIFASLNPEELNRCFLNWVKSINPAIENEIIDIDGKRIRNSFDNSKGKSAIHLLSAWANKAGLTIAQLKVDDKSNEITAIPELLNLIDIENCIITIDAMGTQKKIAEEIVNKKADYVLALKGNQGSLNLKKAVRFKNNL